MTRLIDWERKRSFLFAVFDRESHPGLVARVFEGCEFDDTEEIPRFVDTMQRWEDCVTTRTDMAVRFFDEVATKLDCAEAVDGRMLMRATFEQFKQLIPARNRDLALDAAAYLDALNADPPLTEDQVTALEAEVLGQMDSSEFAMRFIEYDSGQQPSVRAAAQNGALDQRLFYQHPDCADHWENIIIAFQYPTFNKCKFSLDRMLDTATFADELTHGAPRRVVMLGGGGAFSKDCSLISHLVGTGAYQPASPLIYTLLDVSSWMLRRSRLRLALNWHNTNWGQRVDIDPITGDFMLFARPAYRKALQRPGQRTLWVFSGGTLGNVSEGDFFNSLNNVASSGDLFILGVSIVAPLAAADEDDTEIAERYLSPAVRALLRSPIQDLLTHLQSKTPVAQVLATLSPEIVEGAAPGITDVPHAETLSLTATVGGKPYGVMTHTSYDPDGLIAFARSFGWTCLAGTLPGNDVQDFGQFLFRKN